MSQAASSRRRAKKVRYSKGGLPFLCEARALCDNPLRAFPAILCDPPPGDTTGARSHRCSHCGLSGSLPLLQAGFSPLLHPQVRLSFRRDRSSDTADAFIWRTLSPHNGVDAIGDDSCQFCPEVVIAPWLGCHGELLLPQEAHSALSAELGPGLFLMLGGVALLFGGWVYKARKRIYEQVQMCDPNQEKTVLMNMTPPRVSSERVIYLKEFPSSSPGVPGPGVERI